METSDIYTCSLDVFHQSTKYSPNTIIIFLIEETKRKVSTGDPKCGIHTSGYGVQVPIIFHDVSVGFPDYPSEITVLRW